MDGVECPGAGDIDVTSADAACCSLFSSTLSSSSSSSCKSISVAAVRGGVTGYGAPESFLPLPYARHSRIDVAIFRGSVPTGSAEKNLLTDRFASETCPM